jgi:hypothetical protein
MVSYQTAYLVIPKEKARRIITAEVGSLSVYEQEDDAIKIGANDKNGSTSDNWRVSLYDYKFTGERVETEDGSVETGVLGTKMNYTDTDEKSYGMDAKSAVSEYIETG